MFKLVLIAVLSIVSLSLSNNIDNEIKRILKSYKDNGYNKHIRPNVNGEPVNVNVTMHIIDISSVSVKRMEISTDFYFRQKWIDNRLAFDTSELLDSIGVGAEMASELWLPDTFISNSRAISQDKLTNMRDSAFLRISKNGEIHYSTRLRVTTSCPMNLEFYPNDKQVCNIDFESYGSSMADITYSWGNGLGISSSVSLPHYKFNGVRTLTKQESLSSGNFSRLTAEISLERYNNTILPIVLAGQ